MDTERLIVELIFDEDEKLQVYLDSKGIPTIGIGRNLREGISKSESRYLCRNDIDKRVRDLDRNLPWWRGMTEDRQRVLANMCFNMGISRLLQFHNALKFMELGDFKAAAAEMLDSKWHKEDVGVRAERLAGIMERGHA